MTRLLGVLLMVLILYATLMGFLEKARSLDNHQVLARRLGFYGVLTLGVGVLIVTGGIDLSIGSLVGLAAVAFGYLMTKRHWQPLPAAAIVIAGSVGIGLFHGLLVTGLRLQPFLVTLCGLFMYRGLARWLSDVAVVLPSEAVQPQAEWLRSFLVSGKTLGLPHALLLLGVLAAVLALVLHGSIYGRYWYAIGYNEQAARYAGIATERHKIAAYIICSTMAGLGGVLFLLEYRCWNCMRSRAPSWAVVTCAAAKAVCPAWSSAPRFCRCWRRFAIPAATSAANWSTPSLAVPCYWPPSPMSS
jgi:ribose transport system permease protein